MQEAQLRTGRETTVHHSNRADHAAVLIEVRVEDERLQRSVAVTRRWRDALDDRVEEVGHALARLGAHAQDRGGGDAEHALDLVGVEIGIGGGEVDLVQHRDDLEVVLEREVAIGEGLRLDPLRGVDDEHHAFAGRQRPGHLVSEVDVTRRVDEVQDVIAPLDAHVLGLDRDAALALEIHRVEVLLAHLPRVHCAGQLENPVRERGLAMVDVGDDAEIPDPRQLHDRIDATNETPGHRG